MARYNNEHELTCNIAAYYIERRMSNFHVLQYFLLVPNDNRIVNTRVQTRSGQPGYPCLGQVGLTWFMGLTYILHGISSIT